MNVDSIIRKYFYDSLNGNYPVFDSRQGTNDANKCYLVTSQSKEIDQDTKCGYSFNSTIEIEIMVRRDKTANSSSKLELEQMENFVLNAYLSLNLTNFVISQKKYSAETFDADLSADNVNRKVILINFKLNNYE